MRTSPRQPEIDPNGSCLLAAGSPTDTVDSQNFQTFSTRHIAFLVAERPMPAMLLLYFFLLHVPALSKLTVESLWIAPTETANNLNLTIDETTDKQNIS